MAEIKTRTIGRTRIKANAIGVGWGSIGGLSDREAMETIRRAVEVGFRYHDTSPLYGESERQVGLALKGGLRDKVRLQTKAGAHPSRRYDFSGRAIRRSVENSLKVLKTDHLDSVLVHDPPDIEDTLGRGYAFEELHKLKDEGVISHVGLGTRGIGHHIRAAEAGVTELCLTHRDYYLLNQEAGRRLFPTLKKHAIGILIASPLTQVLAGPEPDRTEAPQAHAMWSWCRNRGTNIRDIALHFCLRAPIDGIVITGPSSVRQVEENYASAHADIPPELWADFKAEFGIVEYDGSSTAEGCDGYGG